MIAKKIQESDRFVNVMGLTLLQPLLFHFSLSDRSAISRLQRGDRFFKGYCGQCPPYMA
jgi:hypothetical protein